MAWVLPTGFEDPEDAWKNEVNVLDGNVDTIATYEWFPGVTWSHFLVLIFSSVASKGVKVGIRLGDDLGYYDVDIYDGFEWKDIIEAGVAPGQNWYEKSFEAQEVTKVRIRVRYVEEYSSWTGISACVLEPTCGGPLSNICAFLHQVGTFFIDLSLDIAELWLIGGFLSTPFEFLGELFYAGATTCCSASNTLQTILDTLAEGITADAILALIMANWPTLYYLITDPAGWFLVQLTLAFDLEPWHTQSLEFLAKWILEEYFPTLYQIWLNPEDWFAILLQDRFPILYYLVVDPIGEILYLIGQAFDLTPWEAQSAEFIVKALFERYFRTLYELWLDPEDWLIEHVDPRILGLPTMVAAFFDDPWGWLFDRLEDQIETYVERIGNIALEIVARLLGV